jgi:solute carrier family 35 (UDP-sugar transporter), member A1/2/3
MDKTDDPSPETSPAVPKPIQEIEIPIPTKDFDTDDKEDASGATLFKSFALLLLIAQNVSLVLTMKVSMGDIATPYIVTVAVFMTELLKLVICVVVIYVYQGKTFNWMSILQVEGLKMAVPALLYVVQNNLLYFAVSRLEPAVFQITYQLKIATTALFSVIMLKRTLTRAQWAGVGLLLPGVCLVQLSRLSSAENDDVIVPVLINANVNSTSSNMILNNVAQISLSPGVGLGVAPLHHGVSFLGQLLGFVAVLFSCVTSGFAGVYFEKVLKSAKSLSLWERNVQLATYSILIAGASVIMKDFQRVITDGPFVGMSMSSGIVILLQAAGGLVIAVVVRYTDNIAKAFATSVSMIISSTLTIFFFDFHPPLIFFIGAGLVGMAVRFYSAKPGDWLVETVLVQMLGMASENKFVLPK